MLRGPEGSWDVSAPPAVLWGPLSLTVLTPRPSRSLCGGPALVGLYLVMDPSVCGVIGSCRCFPEQWPSHPGGWVPGVSKPTVGARALPGTGRLAEVLGHVAWCLPVTKGLAPFLG